ncbi:hypothetical protein ACOSP7_018940 [Xanthoceras sorbifolium]
MSSDSQESVPLVAGSESEEESAIKAKSGWFINQSPNPRLKEEVFSESVTLSDKVLDLGNGSSTCVAGDHSSSIISDEYSVEKKLRRRPVTRSVRKSKLPALAADSSGVVAPRANNPLHPPKGEITVSFWSLEFRLRLPIQPFCRRLLADLRVAPYQLSPNFWRYVSSCYVLWHEQSWGDPPVDELKFLFNINPNPKREGLYYIHSWNSTMTPVPYSSNNDKE